MSLRARGVSASLARVDRHCRPEPFDSICDWKYNRAVEEKITD